MIRIRSPRSTLLTGAGLAIAASALVIPLRPSGLEASACAGYDGPLCAVSSAEVCIGGSVFPAKLCYKIELRTYYPPPDEAPQLPTDSIPAAA